MNQKGGSRMRAFEFIFWLCHLLAVELWQVLQPSEPQSHLHQHGRQSLPPRFATVLRKQLV